MYLDPSVGQTLSLRRYGSGRMVDNRQVAFDATSEHHCAGSDMATLGGIHLLPTSGDCDSGLACLLQQPPADAHTLEHEGSLLQTSPQSPFVTCSFRGATSHEQACAIGVNLLQEGLDLLSIKGSADLITKDAHDEYVAWWTVDARIWVAVVATITMAVTLGTPTLTVTDADGRVVPPDPPKTTRHHLAYRFFRLSRVSTDLFDSYRNMYLAFELLLSSQYPKGPEREIDWLRNSLRRT
jgi:hypothetical protein